MTALEFELAETVASMSADSLDSFLSLEKILLRVVTAASTACATAAEIRQR